MSAPATTASDRLRLELIISFLSDEGDYALNRDHVQMLRRFLRAAQRDFEAVR